MHFEYQLTEPDILTHQLYILSQSKSFQKRRSKGRMFILLIYLISGVFIWKQSGFLMAILFYLVCLPLYFLYKKLEANQYKKHIAGFVTQQYKESLHHDFKLEWDEQQLTSSTGDQLHTTPWLELESMVELPTLFVLNFRNSSALILPKKDIVLSDVIRSDLKSKADSLGISYAEKLTWKWN